MKRLLKGVILLQGCLLLSVAGTARAADEAMESYVYGTYFVCDVTRQERADAIFTSLYKPIFDAAVADGSISSYAYYAHNTGGKWRRGIFTVAPSIQALFDANDKMNKQAETKNKKMDTEFSAICGSHDDYIWHSMAGNATTQVPGKAVFSTYYICDSREAQADAIGELVFAPILDKMLADGKLTAWGWMEHIVGGKFRRIATMSAADLKSLMVARGELNDALQDNPLSDLFTEICDSHDDYIWDVKASGTPE